MNPTALASFLGELSPPFTGEAIFDHLSDTVFFMKDIAGQYMVINHTFVKRCGLADKAQLIGRRPTAVLPSPLGESFEAQDAKVLESGQPLISVLELHAYPTREEGWCLTTKLPLRSQSGCVVGLVGISRDLQSPNPASDDYRRVAKAVAYAEGHLAQPPSVTRLADIAGMSRYQLDRRMRQVFGLTTGQWLQKLRIDFAQRRLQDTDQPIATIALDAGYSDQSAFTRQFRQSTGLSPRDYRRATTTTRR